MTTRRALWGLIAVSGLLRLALASSLGLGNDEAYHYLFTVHPDWSYYDHPPMVAVVETVGMALVGGRASELGLRLGFIALFAGSTWLMARLSTRFYGPRAGWFGRTASPTRWLTPRTATCSVDRFSVVVERNEGAPFLAFFARSGACPAEP